MQIDRDPIRIGLCCPVEVGLVGDGRSMLLALLALSKRNESRDFLEKAQKGMKKWQGLMDDRANREDKPMKPQRLAMELGNRLNDDAIASCDIRR